MLDMEQYAAKLATNGRKVQLFTFDRGGNIVDRAGGPIGYGDTDVWPIRFAAQIDEILTNGIAGYGYTLNNWWYARVI